MEMIYQYLWRMRMLGSADFVLKDGRRLAVAHPGVLNTDAGPDFFSAKVRIGDEEWVGNIELHERASDWYRHGHDKDPAYDSVILHVVARDDCDICRADGSTIPQLVISLPDGFFSLYETLARPGSDIRCRSYLEHIPSIAVTDWLESLAVQRLQQKSARIIDELRYTRNDWEQVCFVTLARGLGFGLNGEPFEMLARSLPLKIIHHHSDSQLQIEAILFGRAGMLQSSSPQYDDYHQTLCHEYRFLSAKYGIPPLPLQWKYARTRPQNFPHRRVAMLARACCGGFAMFRHIIESEGVPARLEELFSWQLDGYWSEHFSFDSAPGIVPCSLSASLRRVLMINVCAPLLYAYGSQRGDMRFVESALSLLAEIPPERNSILSTWSTLGLKADSALRSQALIHLKREYCEKSRCLQCRFGKRLVRGGIVSAF